MIGKKSPLFMVVVAFLGIAALICSGCIRKDPITYCGEKEADGPWEGCDPDRYDVDGPAERLLNQGVSRIVMIDLTVGGVRFSKTFDVVQMTKKAVAAWEEAQATADNPVEQLPSRIGVLFVVHGGFADYHPQYLWDASVQMFTYDPNHPVSRFFIWNKALWGLILQAGNAKKEVPKYAYEYDLIGGTDPFDAITKNMAQDLQSELDSRGAELGLEFAVDWAGWMSGDDPSHYAYPRFMYEPEGKDDSILGPETATPVLWVNDYSNLMERSLPTEPENWTRSLGMPATDQHVALEGSVNPVAEDPELAALHVESIEAVMSPAVPDNQTGILFLNHALHDNNEVFDPKINDTLSIIYNIKTQLLERHPEIDPDNIVGAYMGIKQENPESGNVELSRDMRGENLGYAWLYESDKALPASPWGYRYWDALEYLKNRGVQHIIISFTQIVGDSVLNLVEIHNQIGKEIGAKTWLFDEQGDFETYPQAGYPFADYWGMWADTDCGGTECCFEMGGCADGRPYPPPRQTPEDEATDELDPHLAYDLSAYGHLGYDPTLGPPDAEGPVQDQYTGTWALYRPPNADPRMSALLAEHVMAAVLENLQ